MLVSALARAGKPRFSLWAMATLGLALAGCATWETRPVPVVAKWDRLELTFQSSRLYANALQQVRLQAVFKSPSGEARKVEGFWDGGYVWRMRFAPNEAGDWTYTTACTDHENTGLQGRQGRFVCTAPTGKNRFTQHGPVQVSQDRCSLAHEDGTPFFWLADTAWNGPLLSTPDEWRDYLQERVRQKFTAVQWVTTQWRAAPKGDRLHETAFDGRDSIALNLDFFRRLDQKIDALSQAGLLSAPVLLWAIGGGSNPQVNPGYSLPEDQAILLARYQVARWGAHPVIWILAGDGDYRGPRAERWKKIGRAVFGDAPHAPVVLHPGGRQWIMNEFRQESWLDICGYQSGHGDDDRTLRWMIAGPPATDWKNQPPRPFINLEPPYENHLAYQSRTRISAFTTRRAIYWSLLLAPTAGVSYGGHGVWGWDDGTQPPVDHPSTGIPLPWPKAMRMPAAEQMTVLADFFTAIKFPQLRPAPELLTVQPGAAEPRRFIAAARSDREPFAVIYTPEDSSVEVRRSAVPSHLEAVWLDPRTGAHHPASPAPRSNSWQFTTPDAGDWILWLKFAK
jgi:hypothetical protein